MNPYYDVNFIQFLGVFFERLLQGFAGQLYSDEVQIGVLLAVGLSGALVGTFLILKKMTMLANSISHTILLGIVLAYVFGSSREELAEGVIDLPLLLAAAFGVAVVTALVTEYLTRFTKLQEDASTGLVFTSFFAVGIVLVNLLSRNAHIGAEVVMGNVDALSQSDLKLVWLVLALNVAIFFGFFKEWQITSFDPVLAKMLGVSPGVFNYLLMCLVSLTVVGAFRAVGVLMVLTFLTAPPLTMRLFSASLKKIAMGSMGIAAGVALVGVALSRHFLSVHGLALSTGGLVVTLLGVVYLGSLMVVQLRRRIQQSI